MMAGDPKPKTMICPKRFRGFSQRARRTEKGFSAVKMPQSPAQLNIFAREPF